MINMHIKDHARTERPISRKLDLNLLDLFETVYQTRNLTQAGEHLGLTQSAVSRGLGRLRVMYGDVLFVRQQRGVAPTPFSDELAPLVSSALDTVRSTLLRPSFDPSTVVRTFTVALSDVGERIFLPRLVEHFAIHAPGVSLEVVSPDAEQLASRLASGKINLAVGYFGALGKQVHHQRLFRERFVYIARRDHPILSKNLRREQIRMLAHVVGGPEGMLHARSVEKVLGGPRIKAHVALRVHSLLCVGPIVAQGDCIGLVPSNLAGMVASHMPLQIIEPPVQFPSFDVAMVWHDRFHSDPAIVWLRSVFSMLFKGLVMNDENRKDSAAQPITNT